MSPALQADTHSRIGFVGGPTRAYPMLLQVELTDQGVLQLKSYPFLDPRILIRELGEGRLLEVSGYKFVGSLGMEGTSR